MTLVPATIDAITTLDPGTNGSVSATEPYQADLACTAAAGLDVTYAFQSFAEQLVVPFGH